MLEQSFTKELLIELYEKMNKSGAYSDHDMHPELRHINRKINNRRSAIKNFKRKNIKYSKYPNDVQSRYDTLRNNLTKCYVEKSNSLEILLDEVARDIRRANFRISFVRENVGKQSVYRCDGGSSGIYCLKAISHHLRRLYKIKYLSREKISGQLKNYHSDGFKYKVIRTDIKSFFESIPHSDLMQCIQERNILSKHSMKIVTRLLDDYKKITGNAYGLPRGLSISSDLSEIYMASFDKEVKSVSGAVFYARYVDDIILLVARNKSNMENEYTSVVEKILNEKKLQLNHAKTCECSWGEAIAGNNITYLGFEYFYKGKRACIKISHPREVRYKKRIDRAFREFSQRGNVSLKKSSKMLVRRIKFLTSNTKLEFSKQKAHTGIYYNNTILETDCASFEMLDIYLQRKISDEVSSFSWLTKALTSLSFARGFEQQKYTQFTASRHGQRAKLLKNITEVWKHE